MREWRDSGGNRHRTNRDTVGPRLVRVRGNNRTHQVTGERGKRVTVNMTKGQKISLSKADGGSLTAVRMGLGWKAAPRRGLFGSRTREIDLDASAVLFADKQPVDVVFFRHLTSDDGSVRHTGDNLVGGVGQGGDDESIIVDLSRVPVHVDQIIFTVNSFTGQTFAEVENAFSPAGGRDQRPGAGPLHAHRRRLLHRADHGQGAARCGRLVDDGDRHPGQRPDVPGPDPGHPPRPLTAGPAAGP